MESREGKAAQFAQLKQELEAKGTSSYVLVAGPRCISEVTGTTMRRLLVA